MGWREEWKPASFRGIRFYVDTADASFGRRNSVHEYPYKDTPYVEDLGRKSKTISFNAYFLGDNYIRERNRLIQVIESNTTPGTLIHPTLGTLQVKPTDNCSISDNGRQGGKGLIRLEFVEAGENTFPAVSLFTDSGVFNLYDVIQESLKSAFPEVYKVAQLSGFVVNSAIAITQQYIDQFREVKNIGPKIAGKASDFKRNLATFEDNLNILAASPSDLIDSISDLFNDFDAIFSNPSDKYEASKQFQAFTATYEPIDRQTPSRIQETANNDQIIESMRSFSLAVMAKATAEETFTSKTEVKNRRDEILNIFGDRIENAGIAEQNQVRKDMILLRSATVGYLDQSSTTLPDIKTVSYNDTIPAYLIANELYGDSLRYEEIINDNNIKHPLFVPMGQSLDVLTS